MEVLLKFCFQCYHYLVILITFIILSRYLIVLYWKQTFSDMYLRTILLYLW